MMAARANFKIGRAKSILWRTARAKFETARWNDRKILNITNFVGSRLTQNIMTNLWEDSCFFFLLLNYLKIKICNAIMINEFMILVSTFCFWKNGHLSLATKIEIFGKTSKNLDGHLSLATKIEKINLNNKFENNLSKNLDGHLSLATHLENCTRLKDGPAARPTWGVVIYFCFDCTCQIALKKCFDELNVQMISIYDVALS